jgi:hypothetical protein
MNHLSLFMIYHAVYIYNAGFHEGIHIVCDSVKVSKKFIWQMHLRVFRCADNIVVSNVAVRCLTVGFFCASLMNGNVIV